MPVAPPLPPSLPPLQPPPPLPAYPNLAVTVAFSTVAFSPSAIFATDGVGAVSYTAYCARDFLRTPVSGASPLSFACTACPSGKRSLGGVAYGCTECGGGLCLDSSRANLTTYVDASSHLNSSDQFSVEVAAYSSVKGVRPVRGVLASQEVTFDTTPPSTGLVYDVLPCSTTGCAKGEGDIDYSLPTFALSARWDGFQDIESGVASYDYCIGRNPLACDISPMITVHDEAVNGTAGELINHTLVGLPLQGETICISVEATNGAGLRSARVSSDCILFDTTPPNTTAPMIGQDSFSHMAEVSDASVLFGSAGGRDDEAPVDRVEWCFSSMTTMPPDPTPLNFSNWTMPICDISRIDSAATSEVVLRGGRSMRCAYYL